MKHPKTYTLKVTALGPIHIGTGEVFELTNYVVDSVEKDGKKSYKLFEFDEGDFYEALNQDERKTFLKLSSGRDLRAIYKFISMRKKMVKEIAFNTVSVLPEFAKEYLEKVGQFVQMEKGNSGVLNDLTIQKIYLDINTYLPTIPGSSLKGSISTAIQEGVYHQQGNKSYEEKFPKRGSNGALLQYLQVSDTVVKKQGVAIGYAVNRKRFKETKDSLSTRLQYINPTSEFEVTLKMDEAQQDLNFNAIRQSCNEHYKPIFESLFDNKEYIRGTLAQSFLKHEKLELNENQFLLRVGKHSGARAVTIKGMREIAIMQGKGNNSKFEDEETTVWLRGMNNSATSNLLPFGWILCERIGS
jgi:CRISPR-associated protein Csm5